MSANGQIQEEPFVGASSIVSVGAVGHDLAARDAELATHTQGTFADRVMSGRDSGGWAR